MILLDTHVLVWMDTDDPILGETTRRLVQRAWDTEDLAVSAISFWECAMLQRRERILLPTTASVWRSDLLAAGLRECPLDGEISILATQLDLHKDPADRLIAATAVVNSAILLTADERLLSWEHRMRRQDARL